MNVKKLLSELCTPATIYLVISLVSIVIALFYGFAFSAVAFSAVAMQVIFVFAWTFLLNFLCRKGMKMVSWFLILFPYLIIPRTWSMLTFREGYDTSLFTSDNRFLSLLAPENNRDGKTAFVDPTAWRNITAPEDTASKANLARRQGLATQAEIDAAAAAEKARLENEAAEKKRIADEKTAAAKTEYDRLAALQAQKEANDAYNLAHPEATQTSGESPVGAWSFKPGVRAPQPPPFVGAEDKLKKLQEKHRKGQEKLKAKHLREKELRRGGGSSRIDAIMANNRAREAARAKELLSLS